MTMADICVLGDQIFHAHGKDIQIYDRKLPMAGVSDTKNATAPGSSKRWAMATAPSGASSSLPSACSATIASHS
jgi:hypothetical protein